MPINLSESFDKSWLLGLDDTLLLVSITKNDRPAYKVSMLKVILGKWYIQSNKPIGLPAKVGASLHKVC